MDNVLVINLNYGGATSVTFKKIDKHLYLRLIENNVDSYFACRFKDFSMSCALGCDTYDTDPIEIKNFDLYKKIMKGVFDETIEREEFSYDQSDHEINPMFHVKVEGQSLFINLTMKPVNGFPFQNQNQNQN